MNLDRRFRLILILNVIVSMLGFAVANEMVAVLPPVLLLALTGWWVTEIRNNGRGWRGLPRWLSNSILVIMLAVAVLRAFASSDLVQAFTEFLIAILVIKLWERRTLRDYGQLLTLSLFMSVGSTLGSTSFDIGVVWAVHLPLLIAGVMMFQVFSGRARAGAAQSTSPVATGLPVTGVRLNRPAFLRLWFGVLTIAMLISGAIFLMVPRGMGVDQFGSFRAGEERRVGFTEEVEPGAGSLVSDSYSTVLEVKFSDAQGPLGGVGQSFYLRGAVLDEYDQARTKWASRGRTQTEFQGSRWVPVGPPGKDLIDQQITVTSNSRSEAPMFALFRPVEVRLEYSRSPQGVRVERATGRLTRKGEKGRFSYTVRSAPTTPDPSVVVRHDAGSYPSELVKEFAEDVLERANIEPDKDKRPIEDDARAAEALQRFLRTNFVYATDQLKPPLSAREDPTYWFLSEARQGHCEYFASALAAMCRCVGIRAHVIAGYLASEYDAERGVYVVRESDAHAWTEVDTGPTGWVVMDATPAADGQYAIDDGAMSRLRRFYAAGADFWNNNIATFGQYEQEKLLGPLGMTQLLESSVEGYRRAIRRVQIWRRGIRSPAMLAAYVGGGVLVVGAGWVALRAWKRRPRASVEYGWAMHGPGRAVYRDLIKHLATRGHRKPAWSPPLVHLRSVADHDPALARDASVIFELLYAARFGQAHGPVADAQQRLDRLRRDVPAS
jgi:hypothetical protein